MAIGVFILQLIYYNRLGLLVATATLVTGYLANQSVIAVGNSNTEEGQGFVVATYNLSLFNRPRNYFSFERSSSQLPAVEPYKKYIQEVSELAADIKCFQEFYSLRNDKLFNTVAALKRSNTPYLATLVDTLRMNKSVSGLLIASKYPIINTEVVFKPNTGINGAMLADLVIREDTIRVINFHLQSANYYAIARKNRKNGLLTVLKKGLYRHKQNYYLKLKQLEKLTEAIKNSPYPLILVGDLNSLPTSAIYHQINKLMKNSFEQGGKGIGGTLNNQKIPYLRIDNQFCSEEFEVEMAEVNKQYTRSQHFPLIVKYKLL